LENENPADGEIRMALSVMLGIIFAVVIVSILS